MYELLESRHSTGEF